MTDHPERLWQQAVGNAEDAWKAGISAGEMLAAAGWTILFRSALLAAGAARGRVNQREMQRMIGEKVEAATESVAHAATDWGEMQIHLVEAWFSQMQLVLEAGRAAVDPRGSGKLDGYPWLAGALGSLTMTGIMTRSYTRALQPYHRRTGANAKRLARRRLLG